MTNIQSKMKKIVGSRKKEYINYQDFCELIPEVKGHIFVTCDIEGLITNNVSFMEILEIWGVRKAFESNVKFTKTMLAMKALRTLKASDKTMEDCIIDFINYKNLSIKSLSYAIKCFKKIDFNIEFDENVFNEELNKKNIDVNRVKYLITKEYKKSLLNSLKYDKKDKE